MKKISCFIILVERALFVFTKNIEFVFANSLEETSKDEVNVYIFKGEGCGYCSNALNFFRSIEGEYGKYFNLVEYEVWYNSNNFELFEKVASYFNESASGVPMIIVGKERFHGFGESDSEDIKNAIMNEYNKSDDMRFDIMNEFDDDSYVPETTYSRFALIDNTIKELILNLSSIFSKIKL